MRCVDRGFLNPFCLCIGCGEGGGGGHCSLSAGSMYWVVQQPHKLHNSPPSATPPQTPGGNYSCIHLFTNNVICRLLMDGWHHRPTTSEPRTSGPIHLPCMALMPATKCGSQTSDRALVTRKHWGALPCGSRPYCSSLSLSLSLSVFVFPRLSRTCTLVAHVHAPRTCPLPLPLPLHQRVPATPTTTVQGESHAHCDHDVDQIIVVDGPLGVVNLSVALVQAYGVQQVPT